MHQYTLLFTDASGKSSVLNFRDKFLTIQERVKEQISSLKDTLANSETHIETLNSETTITVYTVKVLRGWVYNSVQRVFYGTFQIVPLIDTVKPAAPESTPVETQPQPKPKNVHAEVLLELSNKLKARRLANIPYAPPPPTFTKVINMVNPDRDELVNRLAQRRRQIEGQS